MFGALPAQADYKDDVGYSALETELGAGIPDGSGVPVDQVEASSGGVWMPNPISAEYSGKTITDVSGNGTAAYSAHAQAVGNNFYGNTVSTTPGITAIDSYSASHWAFSGFLRIDTGPGLNPQPFWTASRVGNHSWTGSTGADDVDALSRLDWVIQRDEIVHATGAPSGKLMSAAFNVIAVDPTYLTSTGGSANIGGIYTGGRTKPDLVAPATSGSNAAPRIASAAALLINAGHDNPSWSTDPADNSMTNRNNDTIYNAERVEVIKAALMAGADRSTSNTSPTVPNTLGDITDYRVNAADQTANGLDRRFGAGQLNIYNSYHVVAAGEQNSIEDQAGSAGQIGLTGFDYDPAFGGANGSNSTATYYFAPTTGPAQLTASLVWNLAIDNGDGGSANDFDGTATLYDLDLQLFDVTDSGNWVLVGSSTSTNQNTENVWQLLDGGKDYALRVKPGTGQAAFKWDYGLAWQVTPVGAPLAIGITYPPELGIKGEYYWWGGLSASGGQPPYTYSLVGGWLLWPLTLNSETGVIQGAAWNVGTSYFTIQVMDANSNTATIQSQITVTDPKPSGGCGGCHEASSF